MSEQATDGGLAPEPPTRVAPCSVHVADSVSELDESDVSDSVSELVELELPPLQPELSEVGVPGASCAHGMSSHGAANWVARMSVVFGLSRRTQISLPLWSACPQPCMMRMSHGSLAGSWKK